MLEPVEDRRLLSILVDSRDDVVDPADGFTSLREAIVLAEMNPGDDVITFGGGLSGTIRLSLGELNVHDGSGALEIRATPGVHTIDALDVGRVRSVETGAAATLAGLTLTGARSAVFNSGGGILNQGTLRLDDCTVNGNSSAYRGGGWCPGIA